MRSFWIATAILSLAPASYSCDDYAHEDGHIHHRRRSQITPPSRPLEWGDVNIISTTDTHGWLLGHQKESFPEPNYRLFSITHSFTFALQRRFRRLLLVCKAYATNRYCKLIDSSSCKGSNTHTRNAMSIFW